MARSIMVSKMTMPPRYRKLVLTIHVSASVGWLGAIGCFLVLALIDISRQETEMVRAAYFAMNWIGWWVLVPLSFGSLLTGLIQSLGTEWGLFRHYWIFFKLVINLLANVVLLLFMLRLSAMVTTIIQSPAAPVGELRSPSPLLHASVALLLLLAATVLSVYKPRGLTPHGWRKQQERRTPLAVSS
ncbi:MAG: DUF2269 domain-containing protein [Candidatus Baltobacteraceae bacterium]